MVSYLSLLLLSKDFTKVVHSQCCYALLWLRYLQFSLMPIRGLKVYIQIGDQEIKIVNFADGTTIFLRDFSCFTKIELILRIISKSF